MGKPRQLHFDSIITVRTFLLTFIGIILLTGCAGNVTQALEISHQGETSTVPSMRTETEAYEESSHSTIPTYTPTITLTPSSTPTATSQPTASPTPFPWFVENTPLPDTLTWISIANASSVSALAQFQAGNASTNPLVDFELVPGGEWDLGTTRLAVANLETIDVYDLKTRAKIQSLEPQSDNLIDIALSPDQAWLVAGSREPVEEGGFQSYLELWSGSQWTPKGILYSYAGSGLTDLVFTADSKSFFTAYTSPEPDQQGIISSWNVSTWVISSFWETGTILDFAVAPNGALLATTPNRYFIEVWQLENYALLYKIPTSFTGAVSEIVFSPAGTLLATGHYDGQIRLWDIATGQLIQQMEGEGIISSLAFNPDGSILAAGNGEQQQPVKLWSTNTGELLRELTGHSLAVDHLLFSPDGQLLVSGSYDGTVIIWGIVP